MLPPVQAQLEGFADCSAVALRALLMPDGRVSHYEVEARRPDGTLGHFWALADGSDPADGDRCQDALDEYLATLRKMGVTLSL